MQFGLVIGTATATLKHPTLVAEKMLVVQLLGARGEDDGEPVLVFDRLGAGMGDRVLVTNDGAALQSLFGKTTPGRWSTLGLPE